MVKPAWNSPRTWLAQNEAEVTSFRLSFPPGTIAEQEKTQRLVKAFQKVLDHPDAEQALKHPALKPLLDEASD